MGDGLVVLDHLLALCCNVMHYIKMPPGQNNDNISEVFDENDQGACALFSSVRQ